MLILIDVNRAAPVKSHVNLADTFQLARKAFKLATAVLAEQVDRINRAERRYEEMQDELVMRYGSDSPLLF